MYQQLLKKGRNSVRKGRIKKSILQAQLGTMGDNSSWLQNDPLKTVGIPLTDGKLAPEPSIYV